MPLRRKVLARNLQESILWYNAHRPHTSLRGRTPDEVYHRIFPANRRPRFEPRSAWPRALPCAKPVTLVRGQPGVGLELDVSFLHGKHDLPIVTLRRAA